MENQDIKWETWEEQPQDNNEQPQVNWGEQPQEENIPTWGEQPQQEQPQVNWGEQPQEPHTPEVVNWSSNEEVNPIEDKSNFEEIQVEEWETKTSLLGLLPKLKIESLLYQFHYNNKSAAQEIINGGFTSLGNDGKYKINYQPNTELANILGAIKNIGESRGMKLHHSYLYKNEPKESSINIARGECIYNYIYFLQGNHKSGDVVLDFSSLNGPSEEVMKCTPGILLLLPGWVPYSITKNLSTEDMIAIAGRFTIK